MHLSQLFFVCLIQVLSISLLCNAIINYTPTPPMGWNSWNQFACDIDEDLIKQTAQALVNTGLASLGYKYVNIDDCWQANTRDANGLLQANATRFPSGIPSLASNIHNMGLYLGIYSDVGLQTCQKFPASYGHYNDDAETFASWGIDYLKFDYCNLVGNQSEVPWEYYDQMSNALQQVNRSIVFSICNWGNREPWNWAPRISTSWRTTGDIKAYWPRVLEILDDNIKVTSFASPGHFNDPDMLEVGVSETVLGIFKSNLTQRESVSHFSLWCLMASPLIIGADLRPQFIQPWILDVLGNKEVIAINQDPLVAPALLNTQNVTGIGVAGICIKAPCTYTQVYTRQLSTANTLALVFFNRADLFSQSSSSYHNEDITIWWSQLGLNPETPMIARDLWSHQDVGVFTHSFTAVQVPPHGVTMITLRPSV